MCCMSTISDTDPQSLWSDAERGSGGRFLLCRAARTTEAMEMAGARAAAAVWQKLAAPRELHGQVCLTSRSCPAGSSVTSPRPARPVSEPRSPFGTGLVAAFARNGHQPAPVAGRHQASTPVAAYRASLVGSQIPGLTPLAAFCGGFCTSTVHHPPSVGSGSGREYRSYWIRKSSLAPAASSGPSIQ